MNRNLFGYSADDYSYPTGAALCPHFTASDDYPPTENSTEILRNKRYKHGLIARINFLQSQNVAY